MIKPGGRLAKGGALRRRANMVLAIVVCLLGMSLLAFGSGVVPPLGPAMNPGAGVWNAAAGAAPVKSETISLPGMHAPATVTFDSAGIPTVRAGSEPDAYLVQGYLQARFRLTEMDMERRIAEGRLAEFVGPPGVESDTFELLPWACGSRRSPWEFSSG
jgi:penicillin amidase